ncbi:MAG TPA: amidase [Myxococcaceae bacterium]|nr:amidase [Myxococcaceae bacterium]
MERTPKGPGVLESVSRRRLLQLGVAGAALLARESGAAPDGGSTDGGALAPVTAGSLDEVTLDALQAWMASGEETSRSITQKYLDRIAQRDGRVRSVLEINPDALAQAETLDRERKAGKVRGPLHGIPVLLKDNIATKDRMHTTAVSLALLDAVVPADAFLVGRLREAGAVLLGKTQLSEWANLRSSHSSSGWSGRGGQCRNAYALDRSPSGSSSGSGVAVSANLCAVAVGTETDGSVVSPSAASALVGVKPTVGLVSRSGVIPISHSQDTAGPMARTVRDAALLLEVLAGRDPADAATTARGARFDVRYRDALDRGALKGARIGVPRPRYFGYHPATDALAEDALKLLRSEGAILIDPAPIATAAKMDEPELEVLLHEFKADLNAYLARLGGPGPRTLQALIEWNQAHADTEMPLFGQELFIDAEKKGPLTSPAYRKARDACVRLSRKDGIDATMEKYRLDALVAPTQGPAWLIDWVNGDSSSGGCSTPAAVAGYPHVTVPMGQVRGLPVGLSFFGRAWSEARLLGLAYAYEQASKARKPPTFAASAVFPPG